jgi:beta-glucosidase
MARAVRAARGADVAVVIGGLNHDKFLDAESADRKDLKLPYGQDELIARVVAVNPRTVIVLFGGGPVEMGPWLSRVPAVVQAWYPGMEGGNALARILFGDVNPSGKLPCTFPKRLEDSPAHALGAYPGENLTVRYEEGLLVGYRWFDAKKIEPLFPFGHGLSYTSFRYSGLRLVEGAGGKVPVLSVVFDLVNTGTSEGAEVAQVYVSDESSSLPRPPKELKGFRKVFLNAGERQTVSVPLERSAFAFYDPERRQWVAEKGDFKILVGSSSRDIRLEDNFRLARTVTDP